MTSGRGFSEDMRLAHVLADQADSISLDRFKAQVSWTLATSSKLGFVHLDRRSSGERQSISEAIEEGARDFDDLVG